MKRKLGCTFTLVVVLALLAGSSLYGYKYLQKLRGERSNPAVSTALLPQRDQDRLQSALDDNGILTPSSVLTPDFTAALNGRLVIPAGAIIRLQPNTFRASGNYGVVNAIVSKTGKESTLVGLLLTRQDNTSPWRVDTLLPAMAKTAYVVQAGKDRSAAQSRSNAPASGCEAPGKNIPVLFVHGFKAGPAIWGDANGDPNSMDGMVSAINGVKTDKFDYQYYSLQWVTNPNIGAALATRILCLSQSSRVAGGSGKVIVVAHSMGGLALKEAIKEQPRVAAALGLVVTIATPNDGSTVDRNITQAVLATCNLAQATGSPLGLGCTADTIATLNAFNALPGLQANSPEIKALPNWPASVPVYAIAGNIATRHLILLWDGPVPHFEPVAGNPSGQDTLVAVSSALHGQVVDGLGGTREFDCTTDSYFVLPFGLTTAPCDHNALLANSGVEAAVVDQIKRYLDTNRSRPPTPAPSSSPQPVACAQTFNAGSGWQNAIVRTTIQRGSVGCGQAVQVVQQFLSSNIGSSGANQIGPWGCTTQYKSPAKVAGMCSGQSGQFAFVGT